MARPLPANIEMRIGVGSRFPSASRWTGRIEPAISQGQRALAVDFEIKPLRGVGAIEFGMSPAEVRSRIPARSELFRRTDTDEFPSDYFKGEGVFAYYDKHGRLEAMEFGRPANPMLDGVELLRVSCEAVMSILRAKDPVLKQDRDGALSHAVGVGFYAPSAEGDLTTTKPCESIIAFRPGYYD
jgi:hypothetical protein